MGALASKKCVPCQEGAAALKGDAVRSLLRQLDGWEVVNGHHLVKEFKFPDFATALAFVNRVGEIAETESHHPDITLSWGKVGIRIWTHKIDGLSESDFMLAAKIDALAH
ncbi:MAG: 4a-hydroxytetrahydrobiopterin dehydratase [Planctomycetes bacterium]|nr:4a-hydroxytetrahydrobiopterin dehydratase [Planctomycetota bacterium]